MGLLTETESAESTPSERKRAYPNQGELPLKNLQVYGMGLWRDEKKEEAHG